MSNTIKSLTFDNNLDTENFLLNGQGNPLKTSNKYNGVSSQSMINSFEEVGYQVRSISKPNYRDSSNKAFNKHIIRLASNEAMELFKRREVGISFPEIVIVNNNNNRGSLQVMLGIFRLVCSNGMILGENFYSQKIRHDSKFANNLTNSLYAASGKYDQISDIILQMQSKLLTNRDVIDYREYLIHTVIKNMIVKSNTLSYDITSRFNPIRQEDMSNNLWTVFNRYQEYVMRNGISYSRIDHVLNKQTNELERKLIRGTTREIKSVDRIVSVNQTLMDSTLKYFNIAA